MIGRGRGAARVLVAAGVGVLVVVGVQLQRGPASSVHASTAPLTGPIAVSGAGLVDVGGGGRQVVLQGVNVLGEATGPVVGGIMDDGALQTAEGWGATQVRVQLSSDALLQDCPGEVYDPNYASELATVIGRLTSSGIFVDLDMQDTNPGCHWPAPQTSKTAPLPGDDVTQALAMLVRQYATNRLVGYELFNEPQACALTPTGPGASLFVSSYSKGGFCADQQLAALAWSNPGTVTVAAQQLLGIPLGAFSYHAPGMNALYQTVMQNVPAGDPAPLVFLDANYFASDPGTFDNLSGPLATAPNVVAVFHPYDCQDTSSATSDGHDNANCIEARPEACATTSSRVRFFMTDPATGRPWARPVVFNEFNFPAGEHTYQYKGPAGVYLPLLPYQHGYWVNNMISALQGQQAAGWDVFYMQNADVNNWHGAYTLFPSGITSSTPTPWPADANDQPAVNAMAGQALGCEEPPAGFG